jgi:diguanylate cyclase (GGDEF)-like protein
VVSPYQPAKLQKYDAACRRAARDAALLIRIGHWCGIVTAAAGCAVLLAYALDVEAIWRPIQGGSATHPITAILFVAGGLAVASVRALRVPRVAVVVLMIVALVGVVRLVEIASGVALLQLASPFPSTLAREAAEGSGLAIGWNSALMFVLVPLAFLLRYCGLTRTSQIMAAAGMGPVLVALTGYVYGVKDFYGAMSLTTVSIGILFSASPLFLSARSGIVRAIISPWDGGRFGRLEIAVITAVLFVGGYTVHHASISADRALPVFIVVSILAASATIALGAILIERNDWLRRRAERSNTQMVLRDALTGLYNRRFLKEQEKSLVAFARRKGYRLSVLMIDIDRFKAVNDTYGHPVGDQVIRRIAHTIRDRLRSADISIRYGGEEMLAILLDADLDAAERVAEELRAMVEAIDFSDVGFRSATISIGGAEVLASLTEAIGRADVALYLAKKSGRNRVVVDETRQRPSLIAMDDAADPQRLSA